MIDHLVWGLQRVREHTLRLVTGFSFSRATEQATPDEHHPVSVVGHLCLADAYLLSLLGGALPEDFPILLERYGSSASPRPSAAWYHPLDELVWRLAEYGTQRQAALSRLGVADLARPLPDGVLVRAQPTIGHHLQALLAHEGYHAGQLAAWRRARGFTPVPWAFATPMD
jgi:DinB superfamily